MRLDVMDISIHALLEVINQQFHFPVTSLNDQFNPTVGQVAHVSVNVILQCDIFGGAAKADALYTSVEEIGPPFRHSLSLTSKWCCAKTFFAGVNDELTLPLFDI